MGAAHVTRQLEIVCLAQQHPLDFIYVMMVDSLGLSPTLLFDTYKREWVRLA
jgi:hypothetical protein